MLRNIRLLRDICKNSVGNCEINRNVAGWGARTLLNCDWCRSNQNEGFHTNLPRPRQREVEKSEQRHLKKFSEAKMRGGTTGESSMELDSLITRQADHFPDETLPDKIFNGIAFKDTPIIHIRSSRNNTIMGLTDPKGRTIILRSCGIEGFKNAKKGTNVAAQATGTTFGTLVLKSGFESVRVGLNGLGPGRLGAIKGLQLSGVKIISVTDTTPFSDNPPRSKKRRRL